MNRAVDVFQAVLDRIIQNICIAENKYDYAKALLATLTPQRSACQNIIWIRCFSIMDGALW